MKTISFVRKYNRNKRMRNTKTAFLFYTLPLREIGACRLCFAWISCFLCSCPRFCFFVSTFFALDQNQSYCFIARQLHAGFVLLPNRFDIERKKNESIDDNSKREKSILDMVITHLQRVCVAFLFTFNRRIHSNVLMRTINVYVVYVEVENPQSIYTNTLVSRTLHCTNSPQSPP